MTVKELRTRMTSREFSEWVALYELEAAEHAKDDAESSGRQVGGL